MKKDLTIAAILFGAAFLIRLLYAIPGFLNPELPMRPDSITYLAPAQSLAERFCYSDSNGIPTALRVPLYPFFLSFGFLCGGLHWCLLITILLSAFAVPAVWLACRELGLSEKISICGTLGVMLTPTALAFSPMFLSDAFFLSLTAWELLFLLKYLRHGKRSDLLITALIGGFAGLTRPLNLLWIVPCLFAAVFAKQTVRRKTVDCVLALLIFSGILFPWVLRNHAIGAGWRIDAVSADSLKHNAAVVESRDSGIPAEQYRLAYDAHFRTLSFSTEDQYLTYQEHYLSAIIRKHLPAYFKGWFHPVNFVPDVPSFLENLGLTQSGRGTWDVIISHGLFAGIRHYFQGHYALTLLVLPLSLLLLAVYLLALYAMIQLIRKRQWLLPLLFVPMSLYYYAVTGPVAYPRFSLPGLPMLCLLAAMGLHLLTKRNSDEKTA